MGCSLVLFLGGVVTMALVKWVMAHPAAPRCKWCGVELGSAWVGDLCPQCYAMWVYAGGK